MPAKNMDKEHAILNGLVHYEGLECKHCQRTTRYTNGGGCIHCAKFRVTPAKKRARKRYDDSEKGTKSRIAAQERYRNGTGRNTKLLKKYGITSKEYDQMLSEQGYSCAICEKHQDGFSCRLAVDHNHNTGLVRGLLCGNCNTSLGLMKDDISILEKAVQYLRK